jgi:ATP-binding cassette subfamily B protein
MIALWLLMLGMLVAQLVNPQIIGRFLDAAESGHPLNVLIGAAGLFILIAIIEQLLRLAGTYMGSDVGWPATNRLREDVARHCLKLDLGFYKVHSPGEMIERIDGDINELGNFFSNLALNLINNLLLLVGVLVLLWWQDWRIGAAVTICAMGGLLAVNVIRTAAVPHWRLVRQATGELYGSLEEWLGGTQDIRPNGAEAYIMRRLFEHLRLLYDKAWVSRYFQMAGLAVPITKYSTCR